MSDSQEEPVIRPLDVRKTQEIRAQRQAELEGKTSPKKTERSRPGTGLLDPLKAILPSRDSWKPAEIEARLQPQDTPKDTSKKKTGPLGIVPETARKKTGPLPPEDEEAAIIRQKRKLRDRTDRLDPRKAKYRTDTLRSLREDGGLRNDIFDRYRQDDD